MTPAESNQVRREAAIRRGHRIDAIEAGQLANFLHRIASIEPSVVDRVLAEFDANAPKPRAEKQLHPVEFYGADPVVHDRASGGMLMYCRVCPGWASFLDDGHTLDSLYVLAREHSGIEP